MQSLGLQIYTLNSGQRHKGVNKLPQLLPNSAELGVELTDLVPTHSLPAQKESEKLSKLSKEGNT